MMISSAQTIFQVLVILCIYDNVYTKDNAFLDNIVETSSEVILNVQKGILKAGAVNPEVPRAYQMQEELMANKILIDNQIIIDSQSDLLDVFSNTTENLTRCERDLIHTLFSINDLWAIQMIDAFGKVPSGILRGHTIWSGAYDECLNVRAPPKKPSDGFTARHAWLTFMSINNGTVTPRNILLGACLPSSCADDQTIPQDYSVLIQFLSKISVLRKFLSGFTHLAVSFLPISTPLDTASIACIVICSIFVALAAIGTLVDIVRRLNEGKVLKSVNELPDESNVDSDALIHTDPINDNTSEILVLNRDVKSLVGDLLVCFSVISNTESILDVNSGQGHLQCVHGIRFISMAWVILGHTYYFSISSIENLLDLLDLLNTWPIQVILQGTYSVDTFFLLSGCLMTYLFFKNKHLFTGIKPWVMFYVHRYVRLTPVYAMLIFVLATWFNSVGNGPFWTPIHKDLCAKSWWWNILYVNNFIDATKMCMGWSWYLANDMQFFVISPIFLIAFKRSRIVGYTIVLTLLVASWIATGVISRVYNIPVIFGNNNITGLAAVQETQQDSFNMVYEKPYTRIGPYLIGVIVGMAVYNANRKTNFLHKSVVIVGWVVSQAMSLALLYGLQHADLGPITSSAHLALARTAWAITVAWVIYACLTGHAGPVNTLLSWKVWIPLSRLTYCAYLVHPMLMMWYFGTLRNTLYFSTSLMVSMFLSLLVLSYGLAFIASVLFEAPILKLEKFIKKL